MSGADNGQKQQLKITRCEVSDDVLTVLSSDDDSFSVMINPAELSTNSSISYNGSENSSKQPVGKSSVETKFNAYKPEKLSFNLVFDSTGVVNPEVEPVAVKDQVKKLNQIVYFYNGEEHEPSVVKLLWGSFSYIGRLESMSTKYTLFKPSGEPLRAKIDLSFCSYTSVKEEALQANRSSPDLTHFVEVKAGDTLPLLCFRIYKNSAYYPEIAKINQIVNFRQLVPGTKLQFPPLK